MKLKSETLKQPILKWNVLTEYNAKTHWFDTYKMRNDGKNIWTVFVFHK